jgi:hypothetical protein
MPGRIKSSMMGERQKLEEMYHRQGLSLTDIGKHYGCSRQYVQLVFKALGIERRTQEDALRLRPRNRKSKYEFGPEHDDFILKNCTAMTDHEIASKLEKPTTAVTYRRLVFLQKKKVDRRNFTSDENHYILKNYRKLPDIAMARELNRSLISITHHRNRILNRPKRNVRIYTASENRYIMENYKNMTDSELAAFLNRSKASIAIHRNEVLGLAKTNRAERRED